MLTATSIPQVELTSPRPSDTLSLERSTSSVGGYEGTVTSIVKVNPVRVQRIELCRSAWKAEIIPVDHTRIWSD
jgi:hypothetical protein